MNNLAIIGNLTRDPELRTVNGANGQTSVCALDVAVNEYRKRGEEQETTYFRCSAWGVPAENAARYLRKGSKVYVTGPVSGRVYTTQAGETRMALEIRHVEKIEYLSKIDQQQPGDADDSGYTAPPPAQNSYIPANLSDDDLPF